MADLDQTRQIAAAPPDRCLNCGSSSLTWGRLVQAVAFQAEGASIWTGADPVFARRCDHCKNIQLFEVEYGQTRPRVRKAPPLD